MSSPLVDLADSLHQKDHLSYHHT